MYRKDKRGQLILPLTTMVTSSKESSLGEGFGRGLAVVSADS